MTITTDHFFLTLKVEELTLLMCISLLIFLNGFLYQICIIFFINHKRNY